ncbi:hypothetical protein E4T56_gene1044 [Termitomyces sp. T112]|nr:hypothetical protein E4T56_gene1044 [Termitomyces sp. T112]
MEKGNRGLRQSSLPSSLIPHLYSRPQHSDISPTTAFATTLPFPSSSGHGNADFTERSEIPSMRTHFTLPPLSSVDPPRGPNYPNYNIRHSRPGDSYQIRRPVSPVDIPLPLPSHSSSQHYGGPIYSDPQYHASLPNQTYYRRNQSQNHQPPFLREPEPPRGSWREGEAGPSSFTRTAYEPRGNRGRRGSSQPAQTVRPEPYNFFGDILDRGAESYPGALRQGSTQSFYPSWPGPYQSRSYASQLSPDYLQFPLTSTNPSQGWSRTGGDHPSGYSPSSVSDASSDGRVDNDDEGDETYSALQKGKKRRRDSDVGDDSKKSRSLRKTAVACNFCRGRKLRCDGTKPSCSNCLLRKSKCEYVTVQRRRGPGKAKKGTKSKKGPTTTGRMDPSPLLFSDFGSGLMPGGTEPTISAGTHTFQATEPTMSLETFTFHTTEGPPGSRPSQRIRGTHSPSASGGSDTEKRYGVQP